MLLIGDSVTVYADTHLLNSDSIRFDYALRGQKLNPMVLAGASTGCKFTSYHYHGYPEHDVVTVRRTLVDNSCYSEPIPKIYWIETGVTKEIHGLNCKQALCNFRGRDYVAYYSPDIPLSVGPHIFGGLPGLIMELQDSKGEYMWNLILFEPCDYEHILTINLKKLKPTTRDLFREIEYKVSLDPGLQFKGILDSSKNKKSWKPRPYNPIEKF